MFAQELAIVHQGRCFAHPDAARIFQSVLGSRIMQDVVIDLNQAVDATTSAFARLVLLRRELHRTGRELRLRNLRDRAARLYEVSCLQSVLPRI